MSTVHKGYSSNKSNSQVRYREKDATGRSNQYSGRQNQANTIYVPKFKHKVGG